MTHDPGNPADRRRADLARGRFLARQARLQREEAERVARDAERAQAAPVDPVAAALARARAKSRS
jgi:Na+-translocating ferredoxin:NAD+ oxidoreductase RnfC subunit